MKPAALWLKKHWPIPALSIVALAALPTAMYFAAQMRDKFHADYAKSVNEDANSVSVSTATIKYGFPAIDGSGNVLEKSAPANEAMIGAYKAIWENVQAKVGVVSDQGLAFNKGDHKLLMDGVFPEPAPNAGREFVARYIAYHRQLLADARAGEPPSPTEIARVLNDHSQQYSAKIRAELGREPTPDEQAALTKELTAMRLSMVQRRATELSVYADPTVFDLVPASVPERPPLPAQMWDMQERSWIHQDIIRAITTANGASASSGVPQSVVKRINKISVRINGMERGTPGPATFEPGEDKVPLDFKASLTGRVSGPGSKNKWYDVRNVRLEVIISSQDIPKFLDALAATNFMTVLSMHIVRIEPLADLREGFDYGPQNVVKATMDIETVWLREWRKALMPKDVQVSLGMVEGVEAAPVGGAAPPPPPPPSVSIPANAKPAPRNPNAGRPPPGPGGGGRRPGRGGGDD